MNSVPAVIAIEPRLEGEEFTLRDAFAGETLTPGQEELIAELERFLSDDAADVFLLKGYAGTGKTFITRGLGRYLEAQGRTFCLMAPTGRAAKVIAAKSGFDAETLHKKVYDYTKFSEYTDDGVVGSETFKAYLEIAKNDLPANTVFIVDEASLVSDVYQEGEFFRSGSGYLLKDFLTHVGLDHNDHDKKVIFIGDAAQLPPVDMAFSPALDEVYLRKTYGVAVQGYELKDVVRQKADSAVMRNVQPLRDALEVGIFNKIGFDFDGAEVSRLAAEDLMSVYFESCDHAVNAKSVIISRSNAEAAEFNRAARQIFFPSMETVAAGDKLMVVKNTRIDGQFISNGDFIWVKEAGATVETREVALKRKHPDTQEIETITVALAFREVLAGLRDLSGRPFFFRTKILENLLYDNSPGLGSDEQKALYVDFRTRKRHLKPGDAAFKLELQSDPYFNALRVKFGYALTCHKAQGSEWEHVFVSCPTTQNPLSADAFRWLYTAMTRTSDRVYLINPPHRTLGGDIGVVSGGQGTRPPGSADSAGTFGLSEEDGALFAIVCQVQVLLDGTGIEIESIIHNQYQEAYFFRRGEEAARLNIAYNARGRVKSVAAVQKGPLSEELARRLGGLTNRPLPTGTGAVEAGGLSRPFLQEYHDQLEPMLRERRIRVASLTERPWCVRYAFERDGEVATIDIWYNNKSRLTKCQPVDNACTVGPLLPEVVDLLTGGMKA
ncbi:RecD-like DNA helicase Atu2026 [Brevundimonas diminuta 3F5N]|uniref:RecD-like DNA helicase Atu2026 n=1 Tax=Brevundimonas diminuta 3F5N TaxID=1255603 RepID=A0A1R4G391_BREDI|nr:RecD-like DNA helicase Atu2026 [Brevundimonas diminuta 3F5N]